MINWINLIFKKLCQSLIFEIGVIRKTTENIQRIMSIAEEQEFHRSKPSLQQCYRRVNPQFFFIQRNSAKPSKSQNILPVTFLDLTQRKTILPGVAIA